MTEFEHEDPSAEDQRRKAALQAHMEASQASAAEVQKHAAQSERLRSAHRGLFGHETGADLAASARAGAATVGTGTDAGRPLERLGGTNWEAQGAGAVGPIPGGAYANLNRPADQLGESPLQAYMRTRGQ